MKRYSNDHSARFARFVWTPHRSCSDRPPRRPWHLGFAENDVLSQTLLHTKHLGVVLGVSGSAPVRPEDFNSWLTLIDQCGGDEVRIVFRTGGATPDARQRRALFEISHNRYFRVAVLTDSRAARVSMTEFEWLGHVEIRGFSHDDFDTAFDYLNVSDAFYPGLERKLSSMTDELEASASNRATSSVDSSDPRDQSGIRGDESLASRDDEVG